MQGKGRETEEGIYCKQASPTNKSPQFISTVWNLYKVKLSKETDQ